MTNKIQILKKHQPKKIYICPYQKAQVIELN